MLTTDQSQQLLAGVLGDEKLAAQIKQAKLLLVGCGGIGCEVIKNLLLIGFEQVTMIDLDTIDVSNLNRQFLFNKTHINQSKAQTSASVAASLFAHGPQVHLKPIHGSIQSSEYNVDFFRGFTLVVNALDNRQARAHVNRMCLAADVPLIESGSEGYFGQTFVIKKNVSMCYECEGPKQDQRTFASCTIRNTPSQPIHCIVWAKHLFAQLFGEDDPDNDVSPDMNDPELNGGSNDNKENETESESNENDALVHQKQPSTRKWAHNIDYDTEMLFNKLFRVDIEYLHTMDKLWKNRTKPRTIQIAELPELDEKEQAKAGSSKSNDLNPSGSLASESNGNSNSGGQLLNGAANDKSSEMLKDQRLWSLSECYEIFAESVCILKERLKIDQFLVWDKDDEPALNFVTAVSNMRSYCFFIDRKSKFDVKSMAGNIIPAISSTNSIVGGLMVLQILNLLRKLVNIPEEKRQDKAELEAAYRSVCRQIYLRQISTTATNLISAYELFEPNKACLVCNTKHIPEIELTFKFNKTTMQDFAEQILLKKLNFVCPEIQLDGKPLIIWSKDDLEDYSEEETNSYHTMPLTSNSLFVNHVRLLVYDLIQNLKMIITLVDGEVKESEANGQFYQLKIISEAEPEEETAAAKEQAAEEGDDDDLIIEDAITSPKKSTQAINSSISHLTTSAAITGSFNSTTNVTNGNALTISPGKPDAEDAELCLNSDEDVVFLSDDDDVSFVDSREATATGQLASKQANQISTDADSTDAYKVICIDEDDDEDLQLIEMSEKRKITSDFEERSKKLRTE